MGNSWQKAYAELKEYITKNPDIEIGPNIIAIPSDVRPEFYRLFNKVCLSFGEDNLPALLEKAHELSQRWGEVSQSVMGDLKLESIDVDDSIRWFLLDPNDGLRRVLFDPLFDLLKGKKDLAAFEQTAARVLEDTFIRLYREVYQCWTIVSLLKLLSADKVYEIPRPDFDRDPSLRHEEPKGTHEEDVPDAVEAKKISFEHNHMFSFMLPKVIVRSTRLGLFAAFGRDFDFNEAEWRSRKLSPEQEWYPVSEIGREFRRDDIWPDLAIYTSANLKALAVIADYFQMARPDIIVEFREEKDWYEKEGLEPVRRHYNVLKPRLGSFVVCREAVSEAAIRELEDKPEMQPSSNIHLLSVGWDMSKAEPIIRAMLRAQTKPDGATPAGNPPANQPESVQPVD